MTSVSRLGLFLIELSALSCAGIQRSRDTKEDVSKLAGCYEIRIADGPVRLLELSSEGFVGDSRSESGFSLYPRQVSPRTANAPEIRALFPWSGVEFWYVSEDGRVHLSWFDGLSGMTAIVVGDGQRLDGHGSMASDVRGSESREPPSRVVLERADCGPLHSERGAGLVVVLGSRSILWGGGPDGQRVSYVVADEPSIVEATISREMSAQGFALLRSSVGRASFGKGETAGRRLIWSRDGGERYYQIVAVENGTFVTAATSERVPGLDMQFRLAP